MNNKVGAVVKTQSLQAQGPPSSEQSTSAPFHLGLDTGAPNGALETLTTNLVSGGSYFVKTIASSLTPLNSKGNNLGESCELCVRYVSHAYGTYLFVNHFLDEDNMFPDPNKRGEKKKSKSDHTDICPGNILHSGARRSRRSSAL